jgi:hypothetical protein
LDYLHSLIFTPHQAIKATQLVIGLGTAGIDQKIELADELHISRDGQDLLDAQAIQEYKDRIAEIVDIKNKFGSITDEQEEEMRKITEELEQSQRLGGRSKEFNNPDTKARYAVFNAIKRGKDQIRKIMPNFADYLDKSINTGYDCQYTPSKPLKWVDGV